MALNLLIQASEMNADPQTQLPRVESNQLTLAELDRNTQENGSRFLRSRQTAAQRRERVRQIGCDFSTFGAAGKVVMQGGNVCQPAATSWTSRRWYYYPVRAFQLAFVV